jgi:hypothetical protein
VTDDGAPHPRLAAALAAHASGPSPARRAQVLAALVDARVFLCLAARTGAGGVDMAMLSVVREDGARVVPVFSDGHAVQRWRAEARPRPVDGPTACATALEDGAAGVLLDPLGAAVAVGRDELARLARGWVPVTGTALAARRTTSALSAPAAAPDPALVDALGRALADEPVRAARLLEGPDGLVLGLDADLDPSALAALARRVVRRLGPALPPDGLDVTVVRRPGPGVAVPLPRRRRLPWRRRPRP